MTMMYWTPEIAVGVEVIDNQHKALIERVNSLVTAIETGREEEEIGRLFEFLKDYTQTHFAAEERLMRDRTYSEMDAHVAEHREFRATLAQLEARMAVEGMTAVLCRGFEDTIIDWLFDHICQRDRAFGKVLGAGDSNTGHADT
jgi:hemerythrin